MIKVSVGITEGSVDITEKLFTTLGVYRDADSRSAALNMAIDEALLETVIKPLIRFYNWDHPALSFGYFGKFADVENLAGERDLVRRWTGGGIVLHGHDLTYSVVIPANEPVFSESPMSIYEKIHAALRNVLVANGAHAELASVAALYERRSEINSAIADRRYRRDVCFANPVRADVLSDGRKVAGAAQRRTRRGLLQQGSIQDVDLAKDFERSFAAQLSNNCIEQTIDHRILNRAQEIADQKYATLGWVRRR